MKRCGALFFVFLIACFHGSYALAEKAYVTDRFTITLRTGPSIKNRVLAELNSGQPVEILNTEEGWSHIKIPWDDGDSKEGWVLSRYLITRVPWEFQVESFKSKTIALESKLGEVQSKLEESLQENKQLSVDLQVTRSSLEKLNAQYRELRQGASNYLRLKRLFDSNQNIENTLREQIQHLTQENETMRSSQVNRWFATGALILLCGLLIGLLMGRQQKKRRSLYD